MATTGLVAHVLVAKYADHLPLYRQEAIFAHRVMHADETPVQMLQPGNKKTHRAYLWAYAPGVFDSLKAVIYDFAQGRAGEEQRARVPITTQPGSASLNQRGFALPASIRSWRSCASMHSSAVGRANSRPSPMGSPLSRHHP